LDRCFNIVHRDSKKSTKDAIKTASNLVERGIRIQLKTYYIVKYSYTAAF